MKVTVAGTVFDGTSAGKYLLTKVTGWFDGVDMRRDKTVKPRRHGAFKSQGFQGGRIVTLDLEVYTSTADEQRAELAALAALLADGEYSSLVVEEGASAWSITVGRDGAPTTNLDLYGNLARVRLSFWAPDPLWYEDATWQQTGLPTPGSGVVWPVVWPAIWPGGGSSGRVALVNSGSALSSPVFQLQGGFDTALITCVETGERIGFDRPTLVGSTVEIDVAGRRAILDGQSDVSRWLRYREWSDVPAYSTRRYQISVTNPSGTPMLLGRVLPAWW